MIDKFLLILLRLMTDYFNYTQLTQIEFFYNILVFIQIYIWIGYLLYIKLIKYCNYKTVSDYIYTSLYEHFFGNPNFKLSTILLFLHSLKKIKPKSKVLDFGCGSGTYYSNVDVIQTIKNLDLEIQGIDIDPVYISKCKNRIIISGLDDNVDIMLCDIFDYKIENESDKFDYVIFSESAPLLSSELLESITLYINKNLVKSDSKIIFINNLTENEEYMNIYKPMLKYLTMIDFGRVLKAKEFEDLSLIINRKITINLIDEMSIKEILSFFYLYFIYPILICLGVKNYQVKQYEIIME